jgi:hypothetical protein
MVRARMIAHHHEKRLREAHLNNWEREQMRKATKKKSPGGQPQTNSWSKMKAAWGIGV